MYRVPDDVHHELINWSRWCWLGEWPCEASATPGWMGGRPAAEEEDECEERPTPLPANERHARVVQTAWEGMGETTRKVLRAEYPARDGAGRLAAAQALNLTLDIYEELLSIAAVRIEEACNAVFA